MEAVQNTHGEQIARLFLAKLEFTPEQSAEYLKARDDLGEVEKGATVVAGYKRCGRCGHAKKLFLFNKNSASKTHTSGNCKECQKKTASKSYTNTKQRRNYRRYYQNNKEVKQKHARKYYEENKETIKVRHQQYLQTKGGKKVMAKAHAKRRDLLATNKGIPYTRELVIDRDRMHSTDGQPVCYLCNLSIEDTSGKHLHIDHVVPVTIGGLDCFSNVVSTHSLCNLRREKDARELSSEDVAVVKERAYTYMEANPDKFN